MKGIPKAILALIVLSIGASSAFASASLELVVGNSVNFSTLYIVDNGAVTCTDVGTSTACTTAVFPPADSNAKAHAITVAGLTFDGFDITVTTGGSNSPNCSGLNGPNCLDTTNINATNVSGGTASISAYFADTGFSPAGVTGLAVGFSTPGETGTTAVQTAYATSGTLTAPNPLGNGVFNPTGGLATCGTPNLTINATPIPGTTIGTNCAAPGAPFSLEIGTTFTAAAGQGFNVNGTISAIPEPASVALFGSVLVFCASRLRRRKA